MGAPEKRDASVLGLGTPVAKNDLNAWRPSQAGHAQEQDSQLSGTPEIRGESFAKRRAAWRPSKANEERLSSLSPARSRLGLRMPRGLRPLITFVLLIALLYVIGKLWFEPEVGQLRPELVAVIGTLVAIILASLPVAQMRRKRKRGDDKSTLRL